jgi:valyl-tRNA synthetase
MMAIAGPDALPGVLDTTSEVLVAIRRAKTEARGSMRKQVDRCLVTGPPAMLELIEVASGDLIDAGTITKLELVPDPNASSLCVSVELAAEDDASPTPNS